MSAALAPHPSPSPHPKPEPENHQERSAQASRRARKPAPDLPVRRSCEGERKASSLKMRWWRETTRKSAPRAVHRNLHERGIENEAQRPDIKTRMSACR